MCICAEKTDNKMASANRALYSFDIFDTRSFNLRAEFALENGLYNLRFYKSWFDRHIGQFSEERCCLTLSIEQAEELGRLLPCIANHCIELKLRNGTFLIPYC